MKKFAHLCMLLFAVSILFTSCREEKSTGEKVENAVEDVADDIDDAVD